MAKTMNSEAVKVDVDSIRRAIRELESPKNKRDRERVALFSALYPDILIQLKADVSKTAIVKKLAVHGVSISNVLFDELLEAEAKRRGEPVPGMESEAGDDVPADEPAYASQAGSTKQETT